MNCFKRILTMSIATLAIAGAAITGRVTDNNGKPLNGIRVTDGFTVSLTSNDGTFSVVQEPRSTIISVVVPADRKTDAFWLPLQKDKTDGYNFTLEPRPKRDSFSFIQLSDQEESNPIKHFYADVRERALAEEAAFVISTGDLCYEKGIRSAGASMKADTFGGVRAYITLGNHDLIGENGTGDSFYEQQCGPTRYAFIEGNVLFIVLPMIRGDRKPTYTLDDIAAFTKSLLDTWEKGNPVFFACHYYSPYLNGSKTFAPSSKNAFSLDDWKMSGFIYGHTHWYLAYPDEPVPLWNTGQSRSGGGGNMPGAIRIFHMDAAGNCTTELAESSVAPFVSGLCAPDGSITAAASATSGIFSSVIANINNNPIELKKQGNWVWSGKCPNGTEDVTIYANLKSKIGEDKAPLKVSCLKTSKSLKLEWATPLKGNSIFGTPVITAGKVIIGISDEANSKLGGIVALDAKTGKPAWEYNTGFSIRNTLAERDGMLYACDACNNVYKLNANDGSLVWSNKITPLRYENNCHSAPSLGDGKVFAGCGSSLRAIDMETGKTLWSAKEIREIFGSTMGPVYSNGKLFMTVNWGYLYALDANTGNLIWNTQEAEKTRGFLFQPTITMLDDGSILRCEGTRGASIFNPENGALVREMEKPIKLSTASIPLVYNGTIYSGASHDGICAIDLTTLQTKWTLAAAMNNALVATVQYRGPSKTMEASPIIVNNRLVCAGCDGIVYIVEPNNGTVIDSFNIGAPLLGSPAYKDGKLYIADYAGRLIQLSILN